MQLISDQPDVDLTSSGVIYLITNLANGKQYVGQTLLQLRQRIHLHNSADPKKMPVSRAIRKYGTDAFTIQVLARADRPEDLNRLEVELIAAYGTLQPHGYNLKSGGRNGHLHPDTVAKIAAANRRTREFLKDGERVVVDDLQAFCKEHGLTYQSMLKVYDGKLNKHRGYRSAASLARTPISQRLLSTQRVKPGSIVSPDGTLHHFGSIRQLCQEHGLNESGVAKVLRGESSHHRGWRMP